MKLTGQFRIPAPRPAVFAKLNDPHFFASCLEGVSDLEEIDADHYSATLETKIAYINFRFDIAVELVERTPERVVVALEGTPRGMVGRLSTNAVANLVDAEGGSETDILYEMELAMTGRLGSLGQPVMKSKAKDMERGFVRKATAAFAPPEAAGTGLAVGTGPARAAAGRPGDAGPGRVKLWFAEAAQNVADRLRGDRGDAPGIVAGASLVANGTTASVNSRGAAVRTRLDFEMLLPSTVAEAIEMLDTEDPAVRAVSGGTALMLMIKAGVFRPTRLVDLSRLGEGVAGIAGSGPGGLRIGGLVRLSDIGRSAEVRMTAPVITCTMPRISNVRVRNASRLGGCLAHGDPHMDLPPILASLRAEVEIEGPSGRRLLKAEDLYIGYYQTVLQRGEIIVATRLPSQIGWRSAYRKTTVRTYDDWPALGVAVSLQTDAIHVRDARVVVSAATEKVTRLRGVEDMIRGADLTERLAAEAGDYAADAVETVDDVQGSAAYKRELVRVEVRRALCAALLEEAVR